MEILASIGLDSTVFIQIAIFLVTYLFLSNFAFKPYFKAFEERKKRTVGNQKLAEEFTEQSMSLELEYESKAREINFKQKGLFDESRSKALHEYDEIVNAARSKAQALLQENRDMISGELAKAKQEVQKEIPQISATIATKLLGKDISV